MYSFNVYFSHFNSSQDSKYRQQAIEMLTVAFNTPKSTRKTICLRNDNYTSPEGVAVAQSEISSLECLYTKSKNDLTLLPERSGFNANDDMCNIEKEKSNCERGSKLLPVGSLTNICISPGKQY